MAARIRPEQSPELTGMSERLVHPAELPVVPRHDLLHVEPHDDALRGVLRDRRQHRLVHRDPLVPLRDLARRRPALARDPRSVRVGDELDAAQLVVGVSRPRSGRSAAGRGAGSRSSATSRTSRTPARRRRTPYHIATTCGRPSAPTVATDIIRCFARNASISSSVILIWFRRDMSIAFSASA